MKDIMMIVIVLSGVFGDGEYGSCVEGMLMLTAAVLVAWGCGRVTSREYHLHFIVISIFLFSSFQPINQCFEG